MTPAPSGLQEVDGLNHLLGNPHPDRYSVPRCISQWSRRWRCLSCSRSILWPTCAVPRTASWCGETPPSDGAPSCPLTTAAVGWWSPAAESTRTGARGLWPHALSWCSPPAAHKCPGSGRALSSPPRHSGLGGDTSLSTPDANASRIRYARRAGNLPSHKLNLRRACWSRRLKARASTLPDWDSEQPRIRGRKCRFSLRSWDQPDQQVL